MSADEIDLVSLFTGTVAPPDVARDVLAQNFDVPTVEYATSDWSLCAVCCCRCCQLYQHTLHAKQVQ